LSEASENQLLYDCPRLLLC